MKLLKTLLIATISVFSLLLLGCHKGESDHGGHKKHWSYTGDTGPAHWGELEEKFEACSQGSSQSPIDISGSFTKSKDSVELKYSTTPLEVTNNGHSIQVTVSGDQMLKVAGKTYRLVQFHFHTPSEHTLNGKPADMVAHLVHKADDGSLAVVAILFDKGKENQFLASIWKHLPAEAGKEFQDSGTTLTLKDLLPAEKNYYHYTGSLTTPPCSEGVEWYVLAQRVDVSPEQIEAFHKLFPVSVRPVQPLHGRKVYNGG